MGRAEKCVADVRVPYVQIAPGRLRDTDLVVISHRWRLLCRYTRLERPGIRANPAELGDGDDRGAVLLNDHRAIARGVRIPPNLRMQQPYSGIPTARNGDARVVRHRVVQRADVKILRVEGEICVR